MSYEEAIEPEATTELLKEVALDTHQTMYSEVTKVNGESVVKAYAWPTELTPKEMVRTVIETLAPFPATQVEGYKYQVVIMTKMKRVGEYTQFDAGIISPDEYYDLDEPYPISNGGSVVRLNGGPEQNNGFSVTIAMDNDIASLLLVLGTEQDDQVAAVMKATLPEKYQPQLADFLA